MARSKCCSGPRIKAYPYQDINSTGISDYMGCYMGALNNICSTAQSIDRKLQQKSDNFSTSLAFESKIVLGISRQMLALRSQIGTNSLSREQFSLAHKKVGAPLERHPDLVDPFVKQR
ncbi:hypothetical protein [uncultured Cohaesibacter sp.]|uniref:hypothetical protein n=1 Tax=uncultured Cohaesibacter sp. TaxID=1002546 RepID=UPI0029C7AE84|nr:hypothetical protein [uncultured Cohaesibacter sp.]